LVDSSLETPGPFRDKVKVLARSLFKSAIEQPRYWRFMHSIVFAPPGTAPETADCQDFYDGVVSALARAASDAVTRGEISPGPIDVRMLILMGAITEAATGYVISGRPQLTPHLADALIDEIFDGWK
jgi:hypothetical protein